MIIYIQAPLKHSHIRLIWQLQQQQQSHTHGWRIANDTHIHSTVHTSMSPMSYERDSQHDLGYVDFRIVFRIRCSACCIPTGEHGQGPVVVLQLQPQHCTPIEAGVVNLGNHKHLILAQLLSCHDAPCVGVAVMGHCWLLSGCLYCRPPLQPRVSTPHVASWQTCCAHAWQVNSMA